MKKPKYPRYQDYVIKNGKLVGEFEQMYQDHDDPWDQIAVDKTTTDKLAALVLMRKYGIRSALEIGCGLGEYTKMMNDHGIAAKGVDISPTAIKKARQSYPTLSFAAADILDYEIYEQDVDAVILSQITWYVLDKLDAFIDHFKTNYPERYLVHQLVTYPPGVQKYGTDKFTTFEEIVDYFGINVIEYVICGDSNRQGDKRTVFIGKYS